MLKRRQMCTAECAKILRRYNEMRLTSNDQRRRPSPTPKYRGSGLKRLIRRKYEKDENTRPRVRGQAVQGHNRKGTHAFRMITSKDPSLAVNRGQQKPITDNMDALVTCCCFRNAPHAWTLSFLGRGRRCRPNILKIFLIVPDLRLR